MEKILRLGVREVTHEYGGISGVIRRFEEQGKDAAPVIVTKGNDAAMLMMPCPPGMERYWQDYYSMVSAFLKVAERPDHVEDAALYLVNQVMIGEAAHALLAYLGADDQKRMREGIDDIRRQMVYFLRNLGSPRHAQPSDYEETEDDVSEEDRAMSRNDNPSASAQAGDTEGEGQASPSSPKKKRRTRKKG